MVLMHLLSFSRKQQYDFLLTKKYYVWYNLILVKLPLISKKRFKRNVFSSTSSIFSCDYSFFFEKKKNITTEHGFICINKKQLNSYN